MLVSLCVFNLSSSVKNFVLVSCCELFFPVHFSLSPDLHCFHSWWEDHPEENHIHHLETWEWCHPGADTSYGGAAPELGRGTSWSRNKTFSTFFINQHSTLHWLTGTSLHSLYVICLQSGLVWVVQWLDFFTSHENVLVILVAWVGSGSWYQSSCLLEQLTSGTMNWTSFSISSHSCHVTGSHWSVPAQICWGWIKLLTLTELISPVHHSHLSPTELHSSVSSHFYTLETASYVE